MLKQYVPSGFCLTNCRLCCRFSQPDSIWRPCLLNEEIESWQKNKIPFSLKNGICLTRASVDNSFSNIGEIFVCPFLNLEDNKCKIYAQRPFECQLYPFLINRVDKEIFLGVDLTCSFIKDTGLQSQGFIAHTQYLAGFFSQPTQLDILRNNPQIIQIYPGVKNLIYLYSV